MARRTRVTPRDRHLIDLQAREGRLIAGVKKAAELGHRGRYNELRMELVKVRERIRRAGGEPADRPLRGVPVPGRDRPERPEPRERPERPGREAPQPRPDRPDRPGRPVRRPVRDDAPEDVPDDEEPPADEDATEGWDDDPMELLVRGIEMDGGTIVQRRGNTVVARAGGTIPDGGKAIRQAIEHHLGVAASVRQLSPNTVRITLRPDEREEPADVGAEPAKKGNVFANLRKKAQSVVHPAPRADTAERHPSKILDTLKHLVHKGPHTVTRLGPNMQIQVRAGFRAAVMEVKPGLYVVAEVPTNAVRQDFGEEVGILPLLLAPMIVKAVKKGMERKRAGEDGDPAAPKMLTGPVATDVQPFGLDVEDVPRWLDADLADEFGCDRCGTSRCGGR